MITRIWHGTLKIEHREIYRKYVEETGMRDYRSVEGNLSAKILLRNDGSFCHIYTVTEWNSLESVKKFAGEDYEKARYYPEDEKYLVEFEEFVTHFDTFVY